MSKGEMDFFQVNLSPAMLTVKGQNNDSYLSQVNNCKPSDHCVKDICHLFS